MTNQITACESFRARKFRFLLVKVGQRAQKIPDRGVTDGVDRGQEGVKTGSVWRVGVVRGLKKNTWTRDFHGKLNPQDLAGTLASGTREINNVSAYTMVPVSFRKTEIFENNGHRNKKKKIIQNLQHYYITPRPVDFRTRCRCSFVHTLPKRKCASSEIYGGHCGSYVFYRFFAEPWPQLQGRWLQLPHNWDFGGAMEGAAHNVSVRFQGWMYAYKYGHHHTGVTVQAWCY